MIELDAVGVAAATLPGAVAVHHAFDRAEARDEHEPLDRDTRDLIRAHAAAVDNIGVVFGEDVFIAIGSILLIRAILEQEGVVVAPLDVAVWAIPTAIAAFLVHGLRLLLLDRRLKVRRAGAGKAGTLPA